MTSVQQGNPVMNVPGLARIKKQCARLRAATTSLINFDDRYN